MELLSLPTGLRVVIDRDAAVPIVEVRVAIAAGAGDDPPGHSGLAHISEHLAFGRLADGRGYDAELAPLAVRTDGWTELDTMGFTAIGPSDALGPILGREVVRFRDGLAPEAVEVERRVIEAERRQNTRPFVLDAARAAIWPAGHPWHRAVDGGEGGTAEDVVAWTRAQWTPDRTVIVIAGDLDRAVVDGFVTAMAAWTGTAKRPVSAPGIATATAFPTVPQAHPDRPALDLAAHLLGGTTRNGREVGQLVAPAGADLRRLRVDGPTAEALDAEREDVLLGLAVREQDRAAFAAYCVQTWGVPDCAAKERAAYEAVDVQAIRAVAARWLVVP